jgi:hypothetical protein
MTQELTTTKPNYLSPQTFEQAERYADKIAASSLCPTAFKGKGGDVLIAMQMGAEVGLSPMQAIQNIAVINGRPSLWGDAALGVVRSHPHCVNVREWPEGSVKDLTAIAYCGVTRKGQTEEVRSFSIEQAKIAGLWGKPGPWTQYPERMLQMRARGFAIRDTFPDALRGLQIAEEAQDIIDITSPVNSKKVELITSRLSTPISQQFVTDPEIIDSFLNEIAFCKDIEELKIIHNRAVAAARDDKEGRNQLVKACSARKAEILKPKPESDNKEFLEAYGEVESK